MAAFHLENLTFRYPGASAPALDGVSLDIPQGAYILVCGRSGSGKSTLLRHLKPVLTPYGQRSGQILFGGKPLEQLTPAEQASKIGFVMQDPEEQLVTDKVWHELAFGLESLGVEQNAMRLRVAEMASFFGIQDWFHREVAELSGGQKQLLNLASVMVMQPEVLILDEPTSQLDPIAAADFLATVRKINLELGTTVILSEHRLEDIYPSADRVAVLEDGALLAYDTPRAVAGALWAGGNPMFTALPTPARVFYGSGGEGEVPVTVREGRGWLREAYGRETPPALEDSQTLPAGEPALRIREAWFRYERESPDVLRGLNFQAPAGSLSAIVGGNGAGKSTLLKAVCGLCRPYRGSVELFGKSMKAYRSGLRGAAALLPQDPKSVFVKETLREDLAEMTTDADKIQWAARVCGVEALLNQDSRDLSGGERQRAALAKVLLTEPRLLLLDEPTKGMDSFFKGQFADILLGLKGEGITIVMVSHDIEFCAEYADQVSMFFDGQILATQTPRRFFGENSFYTTAASRMSRGVFRNAVTAGDVTALCRRGKGEAL